MGALPEKVSGPEKVSHYERVFSLEQSLESLNSLESLENGQILLSFPQSGGSPRTSRISKLSYPPFLTGKWTSLKRPLFQKTPFSEPEGF